jgi:hypothetical protein
MDSHAQDKEPVGSKHRSSKAEPFLPPLANPLLARLLAPNTFRKCFHEKKRAARPSSLLVPQSLRREPPEKWIATHTPLLKVNRQSRQQSQAKVPLLRPPYRFTLSKSWRSLKTKHPGSDLAAASS